MPQVSNPALFGLPREARISLARCKLTKGIEENQPSVDEVASILPVVKHLPWVVTPKSKSKPRRVYRYSLKGEAVNLEEYPEDHVVPKNTRRQANLCKSKGDAVPVNNDDHDHDAAGTEATCEEIKHTESPTVNHRSWNWDFHYCHPLTSLAMLTQPILTPVLRKPRAGVKYSDCKFTFIARGQGKDILARLLKDLGWNEHLLPKVSLQFHFQWCSYADLQQIWHELQPWQLVNHSPYASSLSSKAGFLRHLRQFCPDPICSGASDDETQTSGACAHVRPLHEFVPRSYDLKSSEDLRTFLFDFAVTQTEGALRSSSRSETQCKENGSVSHLMPRLLKMANAKPRWLSRSDNTHHAPSQQHLSAFGMDMLSILEAQHQKTSNMDEHVYKAEPPSDEQWLDYLQAGPLRQPSINGEHGLWVLKDPLLDCGRGVYVHDKLGPLLAHAQQCDWEMIVQKYVEQPFLIGEDKRKFDVRLWVVVTSWDPITVFVHPEPYLRLSSKPFTFSASSLSDPFVHLTNRAVQKGFGNRSSPKGDSPQKCNEDYIWMLDQLFQWADSSAKQVKYFGSDGSLIEGSVQEAWNSSSWPRMLQAVRTSILSCQPDTLGKRVACFDLLGFDFILDTHMQPWLLEVNAEPDLCDNAGPALRGLVERALGDLLSLVIGLHQGELAFPLNLTAESDTAIEGSGEWHLCLKTSRQSKRARLDGQGREGVSRCKGIDCPVCKAPDNSLHGRVLGEIFGQCDIQNLEFNSLLSAQQGRHSSRLPLSSKKKSRTGSQLTDYLAELLHSRSKSSGANPSSGEDDQNHEMETPGSMPAKTALTEFPHKTQKGNHQTRKKPASAEDGLCRSALQKIRNGIKSTVYSK
eukprot:gnl/MRDRNA2_/MRDRNA2_49953_c0_seq2.p1 gnl/MRDRNA2_/MRDRNA2_49953_c0~~gnl/MRDRNA2_/MRDRNA2_49953_c0_seq2.p1  ORF type:complete len:862 (+),score=114.89 gnl/MRDRNA2_/MRDRNA2_49953_c0_seq2:71-2656(+)